MKTIEKYPKHICNNLYEFKLPIYHLEKYKKWIMNGRQVWFCPYCGVQLKTPMVNIGLCEIKDPCEDKVLVEGKITCYDNVIVTAKGCIRKGKDCPHET